MIPTKVQRIQSPQKPRDIKIHVSPSFIKEAKNTDGISGKKCNNCSGYGFTMGITGGKIDCLKCDKTGVELPTLRELQTQISIINKDLEQLKQALIHTLEYNGLTLKTLPREITQINE